MNNSTKAKLKKNRSAKSKPPKASNDKSANDKVANDREEILRAQAVQSKLRSASFAEIVSVLMKSPSHRKLTLADLDWLVVPAIRSNQFQLVGAQMEEGPPSAPVGLALWANVSKEVDQRLSDNLDQPIKLAPDEWSSGDITWIIELVGGQEAASAVFLHLLKTTLKDKAVKTRVLDDDGKRFVKTFNDKH